jgi:NAD dependent epimerase/dehydratase family enzyme
MKELCRTIGKVLNKPCWLPMPALVLGIIAGKMADEVLLASQWVLPSRLLKAGFTFTHPAITEALKLILGKGQK